MKLDLTIMDTSLNIQRLSIFGNIETGHITPLGEEFEKLCEGQGLKLILDVEGAREINCSGIGELIKARNDIISRGGRVVLMGVHDRVLKMISINGLRDYFPIALSISAAIQLLNDAI